MCIVMYAYTNISVRSRVCSHVCVLSCMCTVICVYSHECVQSCMRTLMYAYGHACAVIYVNSHLCV